jgi:hypothetical protein
MAKLIKCPRCQSLIDVTNIAPGNTVKCPDCGGMARIPTGQTGIRPRVPTPAPQPAVQAAAPAREGTRMHQRRGSGSREGQRPVVRKGGGNTGLVIGMAIAAVAVVALLAVMMLKKPGDAPVVKKKSSPVPAAPAPEPEPAPVAGTNPAPAPEPRKPTEDELKAAGADDAKLADWDHIMSYLRTGGAYDDPERAEGIMFQKVKKMGKAAYPYVLKYLDHEELTMAKSAANLLNALTGQNKALPNPTNRAQIKAEWDTWIKANP